MNDKHFQLPYKQINLFIFWVVFHFFITCIVLLATLFVQKNAGIHFLSRRLTGTTSAVTTASKHHNQLYGYSPRNIDEVGLVKVIIEPSAHQRICALKSLKYRHLPSAFPLLNFLIYFFIFHFFFFFYACIVL